MERLRIRAGTCAFADHDSFYPRQLANADRLRYYASFFSVVEIDSTFYGIVAARTWERWLDQVDGDFRFHAKAPAAMTLHAHGMTRQERREVGRAFLESLRPAAERRAISAILLQFPPWFGATRENIATVERLVAFCQPLNAAVEFRERSWFQDPERIEKTIAWISSLGAVHVICDEPQAGRKSVPYVPRVTHTQLGILRMHGRNLEMWDKPGLTSSKQRFDYRYSRTELESFVPDVVTLANGVQEFHVLMNNNSNNDAVWNAFDWLDLIGGAKRPRPMLQQSEQLSLLPDHIVDGGEGYS
ncbi:hypothetical protein URH17368_1400 [Alicyclobacillus hesperidum URH17-3-68]|uniref:DUF72 domain-containing protein n=1 Tax=Alicyclobacillus hesperidum TaxID=89784 RepID=UPI000281B5ED|nr:DUF72 domain-containing protein [Alicyclobacillus hesperidum]EJY56007.1 hypothetical protein URH17368_1400 [Alicyclobacillus hesperidum URH17-3-68]